MSDQRRSNARVAWDGRTRLAITGFSALLGVVGLALLLIGSIVPVLAGLVLCIWAVGGVIMVSWDFWANRR